MASLGIASCYIMAAPESLGVAVCCRDWSFIYDYLKGYPGQLY